MTAELPYNQEKLPSIHPGEVLNEEFLVPLKITQYRLAKEIGVDARRVHSIVRGERAITAETALLLSRFFGNSAEFWMGLQSQYDLEVTEDRISQRLSRVLARSAGWLRVSPRHACHPPCCHLPWNAAMMRYSAIGIYSTGKILLDGVIASPGDGGVRVPAVLICHPHPMLGGDMNNPVVSAVEVEANERGLASMRFDFRGVGRSEGDFSNGEQEWNDVKHALNFLKGFPGVDGSKIGVVGYSFGASVVLRAISKLKPVKAFALVAPPLGSLHASGVKKDKRSKLFVVGQNDNVVPSLQLQRQLDDLRGPVQFTEIPEADHRLNGHEQAVAKRVVDFMVTTLLS